MSDTRIVIHIHGVEDLSIATTMLAAAGARRIGHSRTFAVDGPRLTAMQAYAVSYLAAEDGVSVAPRDIPESWTVGEEECGEPGWMDEHQADKWWTDSYKNSVPPNR